MISVLTACLLVCAAVADQAGRGAPSERSRDQPASPNAMGLQGYSVVLVVGDMQAASAGADAVPSAARKALTDMQAFLPFKRYQLVDAAWMLCCGSFRSPITGKIRGPADRDFSYSIDTMTKDDSSKLILRFTMREDGDSFAATATGASASAGGGSGGGGRASSRSGLSETARAEYSRQLYEVTKERDDAEIQLRRAKQGHDVGTVTGSEYEAAQLRFQRATTRVEALQRELGTDAASPGFTRPPSRTVMDSTFSIAIGETVVIGTSRLKGDQALITLLTAAGKPAAAR